MQEVAKWRKFTFILGSTNDILKFQKKMCCMLGRNA